MNPFDQEAKGATDSPTLSPSSLNFLSQTAKWARFLAILGFIGIGLMVIASLIMMIGGMAMNGSSSYMARQAFGGAPMTLIGFLYLAMAVLYFFPVFYLNNFATRMLQAIVSRDAYTIESAFEQLRNHYRFMGILTIVLLALYVIGILFVFVASAAAGFR